MKELNVSLIDTPRPPRPAPTVRDWAAVGFRRSRIITCSFLLVFGGVVLITWLTPARYESETEILVKRERIDPIVTADKNTQPVTPADVTEQDVNSEVELLKSRDLLEKVALSSGLTTQNERPGLKALLRKWVVRSPEPDEAMRTFRATAELEKSLRIEPLKKTKLIKVTYSGTDPQQATTVLQNLVRLYLDKHLEVHRVPGALDFFQSQTEQYRQGLSESEAKMAEFATKGSVAPDVEKELVLRKLNDFESDLRQTRAAIASTENRIATLEEEQASRPARLTTQMRTADNPLLLQQMKSTLLTLELKRTELIGKYDPTYKLVQEIEAQILQTRDALAKAEANPVREQVTDRDTTHEWLTGELAKARAELTSLKGRLYATVQTIGTYRQQARELNDAAIRQQDLIRQAKAAEENFLLYSRKQEETRISEALDRKRIINVSVAEPPSVPFLPSTPNWPLSLLLGFLLAGCVSGGIAFAAEYTDRSFRTADEVELFLNTPVLASLAIESGGR
jgi:uncharacterized protein involved in exopolysaccharide biosynthesis